MRLSIFVLIHIKMYIRILDFYECMQQMWTENRTNLFVKVFFDHLKSKARWISDQQESSKLILLFLSKIVMILRNFVRLWLFLKILGHLSWSLNFEKGGIIVTLAFPKCKKWQEYSYDNFFADQDKLKNYDKWPAQGSDHC